MKKVGGKWVKKNGQPSKWHNEARGPMARYGEKKSPMRVRCYVCKRQVSTEEWISGQMTEEKAGFICLLCKEYREVETRAKRVAFALELLAQKSCEMRDKIVAMEWAFFNCPEWAVEVVEVENCRRAYRPRVKK